MGLSLLLSAIAFASASHPQAPADEEPRLRGRVVAEGSGAPIAGATISTFGFALNEAATTSAGDGSFDIAGQGRADESGRSWYVGFDYLRIEARGVAPTFVDSHGSAAWEGTIHLRSAIALRGTLKGAGRGARATARIDAKWLSWPPQSGLSCWLPPIEARFDEAGHFEFPPLPTQVPIDLEFDSGGDERRSGALRWLVLQAGDSRALELDFATLAPIDASTARARSDEVWTTVSPIALDASGSTRLWSWFECLEGGRHPFHTGRVSACGHDNRVCNHHEARPGVRTFVARDPAGWIGVQALTIAASDKEAKPTITLAPGALLRIDATALTTSSRVELSANGVVFAVRDVLPGVLRYELAPAGGVTARVLVDGKTVATRSAMTPAGAVVDLRL